MLQPRAKYDQKWYECLEQMKSRISENDFEQWIKTIVPLEYDGSMLRLRVRNATHRDRIEDSYMEILRPIIHENYGAQTSIRYATPKQQPVAVSNVTSTAMPNQTGAAMYTSQTGSQIVNPFIVPGIRERVESFLDPAYTFDTFIEGDCNKLARSIGLAIAENPGNSAFNPMFIHSNSGLGKTHVCQAIGNAVASRYRDLNVLYVSMNKFQAQYQTAVINGNVTNFIHFYQTIDVLIIDDIQELSGQSKQKTQNTFFNIFSHLLMAHKQIILTSDKSPVELKDIEDRLLTRFKWGIVTKLDVPGYETKYKIIKAKAAQKDLELPDEVVEYLATNIVSNVREIEGAVASLSAYVQIEGRKATVSLAREILKDYVKFNHKEVSVEQIIDVVCNHFGITRELLNSDSRPQELVQARQVAMYIARQHTKASSTSIGEAIGKRKHSTVLHACKTVADLIETDKIYKATVDKLVNEIMS
ncbi:MAG: chromosomal replication initiator protein DnaA [Rikenellaceae bacterium]